MQRLFHRFALILALSLLFCGVAMAQTVSVTDGGMYRPGGATPVTIQSDGPGLIEVRGDGVQGIDWPAAGRGSVTVPLTVWRDGPGDVTLHVNGRVQMISLAPLAAADPTPPVLAALERPDNAAAAAILARLADDDAVAAWSPGRPGAQRRWLMLAAIAATLAIGATLPWCGRHGTWAAVGICVIACSGIAVFAPAPPARRELPVLADPRFIEIDYVATRAATVREPIDAGLWFSPRSTADIAALQPVMECDASGKPIALRINVPDGGRARLLRQVASGPSPSGEVR